MYYLIEITQEVGKTTATTATYSFTEKNVALGTFHQKLGGAMKTNAYTSEVLVVIDQLGNTVARECYVAPVVTEAITEE